MPMRYVLAATVALVVGVVVGGMSPRADVRRLEAQLDEVKERECPSLVASELVRAIQRAPEPGAAPSPGNEATAGPADADPADDDPEHFDEARTLLAARRAQARAALIEGADPSPEQLEAFDAAVADMNAQLRAIGEDLLARVRELGEPPPRSELYLYAADGLAVIIDTEAAIRDALGEAADVDPEALDPLSHLDPSHVDLAEQLDAAGMD